MPATSSAASPRFGDGRALLLGEMVDGTARRDSLSRVGPDPVSRGGDGGGSRTDVARVPRWARRCTRGHPDHARGRGGDRRPVVRGRRSLPGAVLTRVAAATSGSALPVRRARGDSTSCAGWPTTPSPATTRPRPTAETATWPCFDAVVAAQATLIAQWMLVGFIHGVMNTDNMTISGETIDYGPCAFMEAYDPAAVFSSIDHGGRYAYRNQPAIAQWNLARLAEALLPFFGRRAERGRRTRRRTCWTDLPPASTAPPGQPGYGPSSA